jgi:sugar lactone lactonase YvrE
MNAKVVLGGLVLGESSQRHDRRLWVADWAAHELIALDVTGTHQDAGRPDSVPCRIDWLSDGSKHCVRVREGGQVLQAAGTDRGCYACPQGGSGGTTLFIATAQWPSDFRAPAGQVLAVEGTVPSARPATAGR